MFRDGGGEGGSVRTLDASEKCVALYSRRKREGERELAWERKRIRGPRTWSTIKEGTLSTLNDSEISSFASASIWSDSSVGYFRASSMKTSVICAHGCAHDAQKYRRDTRWRSAERRDLKCSEDVT